MAMEIQNAIFRAPDIQTTVMPLPLDSPIRSNSEYEENAILKVLLENTMEEMKADRPTLFEEIFMLGAACLMRSRIEYMRSGIDQPISYEQVARMERHADSLNFLLHCRDFSVDDVATTAPFHRLRRRFRKLLLGLIPLYLPLDPTVRRVSTLTPPMHCMQFNERIN
jgi:hypothetical protein